jgi:hypothetical protein
MPDVALYFMDQLLPNLKFRNAARKQPCMFGHMWSEGCLLTFVAVLCSSACTTTFMFFLALCFSWSVLPSVTVFDLPSMKIVKHFVALRNILYVEEEYKLQVFTIKV